MIVALYARVSTGKQADRELSIPDQLNQMHAWCKQEGHVVAGEYIERGASATDDRRPEFQRMIADACETSHPFDLAIVHSYSRFFRDLYGSVYYENKLNKAGVKLVSISQLLGDDPADEMLRDIIRVFDQYQSKENSKHTLRSMKENARQGFFNGARTPFGYTTEEVDTPGREHNKRRLVIDEAEADIVKLIFDLSIRGLEGMPFGIKKIAEHLNLKELFKRGKRWNKSTVAAVLKNSTYHGEHYFNKRTNKNSTENPREEWIMISVPEIVPKETFEKSAQIRAQNSPEVTAPRAVSSPTLLTGLLKCKCGAAMTISTGKGGRYKYYSCTARKGAGKHFFDSKNYRMESLDKMILEKLAENVFTPTRVTEIITQCQNSIRKSFSAEKQQIEKLGREKGELIASVNNLLDAIGQGLQFNDTVKQRIQHCELRQQEIDAEVACLKRQVEMAAVKVTPEMIEHFCSVLREKLHDKKSLFGKAYLKMLVKEIRLEKQECHITGSSTALIGMVNKSKVDIHDGVPTFVVDWLPELDSNQRQAD